MTWLDLKLFQILLIRSGLYLFVFLVFLLYCIEIFILIIQTPLKFRNKLLFNQFVESRENAKHTGDDIHILFCFEGFWGLGKFFNQIINLWLLATPLVTPLATPYIFYLTTLSKILDPPMRAKELSSGAKEHGTVKYDNYASMLVTLISEKKDIA